MRAMVNECKRYERLENAVLKADKNRRCEHGVVAYCNQCLEGLKPEPEFWNKASASAKYDIKQVDTYFDPLKSFGCRSCLYQVQTMTKKTLISYAQEKSLALNDHDIEDAQQQSLEYIIRKPERWQKTLDNAVNKDGEKIPAAACYARLARSKYKNIIRSHTKRIDNTPAIALRGDELSRIQRPENDYKHAIIFHALKECLTNTEFLLLRCRYSGYTLKELAQKEGLSHQAIMKREKVIYKKCHDIADELKSILR